MSILYSFILLKIIIINEKDLKMYELLEQQEKISEILLNLEGKQQTNTKKYQIYLKKFDDLQEKIENELWNRNQPI